MGTVDYRQANTEAGRPGKRLLWSSEGGWLLDCGSGSKDCEKWIFLANRVSQKCQWTEDQGKTGIVTPRFLA